MRIVRLLLVLMLLVPATAVPAQDLVIIVNPASGVRSLSRDEAANIFMGRMRKLPSGLAAMPIDVGGATPERRHFYQWLLSKELSEIDAYWARLVFSGQTSPPLQVNDSRTAVNLVASNRNAIAYVQRAQADPRVHVVIELAAQR